jgi:hypothetical protein
MDFDRPDRQARPVKKGAHMLQRGLVVGGLGLSLTLAGAGVLSQVPAFAQETSTKTTVTVERAADRAAWEAERQERYENFLAKFAANLGISDPEQIETGFRDTLKEMIDEELAAGDIAANDAAELKARIDEADGPLFFGGLGGGRGDRMIGIVGPGGHRMRGGHGDRLPAGIGGDVETAPADDSTEVDLLPATEEAVATPSA